MKTLEIDQMEQLEGGKSLACFVAGLGAVAMFWQPELIPVLAEAETGAAAACLAS